jgi:hypothetical protein
MSSLILKEEKIEKIEKKEFNLSDITSSDFIHNSLFDKEILYIIKNVGHDGYDRDGPKSNIIDLDIIIKDEDNEYIFLNYHKENWFCGGNNDNEYSLYYSCILSKVESFYDLNKFNIYLKQSYVDPDFVEKYNIKREEVTIIESLPETRLKRLLPFYINSEYLKSVIKNSHVVCLAIKQEIGPLYTTKYSQWYYYAILFTKEATSNGCIDYISSIYFLDHVISCSEKKDFVLKEQFKLSEISDIESLFKYFIMNIDKIFLTNNFKTSLNSEKKIILENLAKNKTLINEEYIDALLEKASQLSCEII